MCLFPPEAEFTTGPLSLLPVPVENTAQAWSNIEFVKGNQDFSTLQCILGFHPNKTIPTSLF